MKSVILCDLSKSDVEVLFKKINNMPFVLRDRINLPENITFGTEIEVNGISYADSYDVVDEFNMEHCLDSSDGFYITNDISVDAEFDSPVMNDDAFYWNMLDSMYSHLRSYDAKIGYNTSSHVHLGTHCIRSIEQLSLFIKTLVVFEPIIFKFGYGYGDEPRRNITAHPRSSIYSMFMTPKRVVDFCNILDCDDLDYGDFAVAFGEFVNEDYHYKPVFNFLGLDYLKFFVHDNNTEPNEGDHIEVRCFNGTLDSEISQNNISLVAHILYAVCSGKIDKDYILKEFDKYKTNTYNFDVYRAVLDAKTEVPLYNEILFSFNKVDLNKAFKLADMIFDTEIDKYYFLKQYLKLFNKDESYVLSLLK